MSLDLFDYDLPSSLIAGEPAIPRDSSRLLVVDKSSERRVHHRFSELPDFLRAGDLLVLNRSRVLKARLRGIAADGREFETFLLKRLSPSDWTCLAKPGKKIRGVVRLSFPGGVEGAIERAEEGFFRISFTGYPPDQFLEWMEKHGEVPLPPYIVRPAEAADSASYQTVYAREPGSVAAPTAGLHFTEDLLREIETKGVIVETVTLHVGYGTFSPIKVENLENHRMHEEEFAIAPQCQQALSRAKDEGRRIIAVGTTSLRALESSVHKGFEGRTDLFIKPGYPFRIVDGLITNFHLPKSSLYVLVCAFLGIEATRECYAEAIKKEYRFFSYGDAMAILP